VFVQKPGLHVGRPDPLPRPWNSTWQHLEREDLRLTLKSISVAWVEEKRSIRHLTPPGDSIPPLWSGESGNDGQHLSGALRALARRMQINATLYEQDTEGVTTPLVIWHFSGWFSSTP